MFGLISKSKHDAIVAALKYDRDHWRQNYDKQFVECDMQRGRRDAYAEQARRADRALDDIIAMETPNCASIGRRMAARAKAARTGSVG